jgi:prepilin-type N-terminal cleavage/methylation domain-containing protein
MKAGGRRSRRQAGFTLIELIVSAAIGAIVMSGLVSVVFTTYRAYQVAASRAEASGQIRSFQQVAYDDFAHSATPPVPSGCGTSARPCSRDLIQLQGCTISNPVTLTLQGHVVSYQWNQVTHAIDRSVGGSPVNSAASEVTAFHWYVDGSAPKQSVVVTITVTVGTNSQTQTMRFQPRVAEPLPAYVSAPC